jgi:hypothetical protein
MFIKNRVVIYKCKPQIFFMIKLFIRYLQHVINGTFLFMIAPSHKDARIVPQKKYCQYESYMS